MKGHKTIINHTVVNDYFQMDGLADIFELPSLSLITYFLTNGVMTNVTRLMLLSLLR